MISLIKSEIKKYYSHSFTIIVFILVAIVVFFAALSLNGQVETDIENWELALDQENQQLQNILSDSSITLSEGLQSDYIAQLAINQYRISNNLPPFSNKSTSNFLLYVNNLFIVIIGATIVITSKIFTDEYKDKTILLLLSSPNKRSKIMTSKLIASFILPIILVIYLFIVSLVIGWSFFGFDNLSSILVTYNNGEIMTSPLLLQVLINFSYSCVGLIVSVLISVMLSTFFRNGIVSSITSLAFYYIGTVVCYNLKNLNWLKYTVFPNINFQMYLTNDIPFEGMTPTFSLIILLAYSIPMLFISYYAFNRQEF